MIFIAIRRCGVSFTFFRSLSCSLLPAPTSTTNHYSRKESAGRQDKRKESVTLPTCNLMVGIDSFSRIYSALLFDEDTTKSGGPYLASHERPLPLRLRKKTRTLLQILNDPKIWIAAEINTCAFSCPFLLCPRGSSQNLQQQNGALQGAL